MRLLIDLQGAQSESRRRGIGRYALSLVRDIVRQAGDDEVHLLLNARFAESVDELRAEFAALDAAGRVHVWDSLPGVREADAGNDERRRAAEVMREGVVRALRPDFQLVTSLFEGFGDDVVTSITSSGAPVPTAVVLYDLIPLLHPEAYLVHPQVTAWYHRKLDHLRRADLLLAISASTAAEAVDHLGFPAAAVHNISAACAPAFTPGGVSKDQRQFLLERWGIERPFVLYTSGGDPRKNNDLLVESWAQLPADLRRRHQLVIVSSTLHPSVIEGLLALARKCRLEDGELLVIDDAADSDLLLLYRACTLFVFPSLHEGFGLPVLEAMACGAAVIASSTTSLPEIVGRSDALFNPYDRHALSGRLEEVLGSETLRASLAAHALQRAARYAWPESASRAWAALRAAHRERSFAAAPPLPAARPRLLYLPLPADAPAAALELERAWVPAWSWHIELEFVETGRGRIETWSFGAWRSPAWVQEHGHRYAHVVYALAEGRCDALAAPLSDQWPGHWLVIGAASLPAQLLEPGAAAAAARHALVQEAGWIALKDRIGAGGTAEHPVCVMLPALRAARSVTCIGQALEAAVADRLHAAGLEAALLPLPVARAPDRRLPSRGALGLGDAECIVCVPAPENAAGSDLQLLFDAWGELMRQGCQAQLVLLGDAGRLPALQRSEAAPARHVIALGTATHAAHAQWLQAADIVVVLPQEDASAALNGQRLLQAMVGGAAVVGPARVAPDGLPAAAAALWGPEGPAAALQELIESPALREARSVAARTHLARHHSPRGLAATWAALVGAAGSGLPNGAHAVADLAAQASPALDAAARERLASALLRNFPPSARRRQLLVDVSELAQRDARSGIQRVVRAVLLELMELRLPGLDLVPVYATATEPYRHARRFMARFIGAPDDGPDGDEVVEAWAGDIFLGLDYQAHVVLAQRETITSWYRRGVQVHFILYDLLPVLQPMHFADGARVAHHAWLGVLSECSGIIAISRTVADEYATWLDAFGAPRQVPHLLNWMHIGADVRNSAPTQGMPAGADSVLATMTQRRSWLMVGTIEPRKGHRQALQAFETLWAEGLEANLVLVGRQGWHVEELARSLRTHEQAGKRLFWIENASDEYLERLYGAAACLISASEGEGFGLPLIEGAQHGLPLLCRDLPVFREVAGEHASYFEDSPDPAALVRAIRDWNELRDRDAHPRPQSIAWITWRECAEGVARLLLGAEPYRRWLPPTQRVRWGNDPQAGHETGQPLGRGLHTDGRAGWLYRSPPLRLRQGTHRVRLAFDLRTLAGTERVELVAEQGATVLGSIRLAAAGAGQVPVELECRLAARTPQVELRIWVEAESDLSLLSVSWPAGGPGSEAAPA